MTISNKTTVFAAAAVLAVSACNKTEGPAKPADADKNAAAAEAPPTDPVESAMAAAPAIIAKDAAIIMANPDGTMKILREGTNGFTCMPDNPQTPGHDPMCMDANALKWAEAWMGHKPPPANNVGLMYMLSGGSDASNTDPYGTKPADGKWVETGPHVMVVGAESLNKLYPAGDKPDTTKPYVMFGGTPYAHVMIPIQ
jgi:hypothetical protein